MRKSLLGLLVLALTSVTAFSQGSSCPQDTLKYIYFSKATNFDTTSFDPTTTSALYQYYSAPQAVTVEGVRFYGFKTDSLDTNGLIDTTMTVYVELWDATNDSVPSGAAPLVADTITIFYADTTDTSYNFHYYSNVGMFDNPYTVTGPYTVVVRTNNSEDEFSLLHTEYDDVNGGGDGMQEWLCGAYQGSGWVKSDVFAPNLNNQPFDADFFIEPIVRYDLNASFINDPECLFDELGDTVQFFNDGSIIADDPMYNKFVSVGSANGQTWNFGDGSPVINSINPLHFYPTNGPFAATMTATILTWSQDLCSDNVTQIIKEKPEQDFSYETNNLEVEFTNRTFGLFTNISWDFGDGNSSQTEDPTHKYAEPGTYWVCQTMMTSCGEITQCKNVAVATNTALNCGKDSVRYTSARGTDTKTVPLINPVSGQRRLGVGQRFDAPQSMIVHGFTFYANHTGLFRDSYPVTCRIYYRGDGNLPNDSIGPLAESTVYINKYEVDTFYSDTTRYTAIFNVPVNLKKDEDFVLTIEYDSTTRINIGTTDWLEGDGDQDWLASSKVNDSTWVGFTAFNVNGQTFDADVVIEPLIEYNFNANFSWPFECMEFDANDQAQVTFTDLSSLIARSEVYNTIAFYGSNNEAFEWDFSDSTGISNQINAIHVFDAPGPFDVRLTINMDGWTNDCQNSQVLDVPVPPTGGFSYEQITSTVRFFDESHNAEEHVWLFSDTTVSTLQNPVHFFTRIGRFEVCQYVSNVCGSDTVCDSIIVNVLGIPESITENISIYPNPAGDNIQLETNFSENTPVGIRILDMSGRLVKQLERASSASLRQLYVGDLAEGSYMLEIIAGDYRGTNKLMIVR